MSVEYFDRPVREPLEAAPGGKVSLPEAVPVPRIPPRSMIQLIGAVVMLMLVAILIYVLMQIRQGWFSILPVMMLVMYGVMFFRNRGGNRNQKSKVALCGDCGTRAWSSALVDRVGTKLTEHRGARPRKLPSFSQCVL